MSPEKKDENRRTAAEQAPRTSAGPSRRRTPVALDEPRARWPIALWTLLTLAWLGGTALFFVLVLAEGLAMMDAPEVADASLRSTAWYLTGMLVCALAVPLAGAATAALMRRRIAAALFALATAASAIALFTLASPAELFQALRGGLGGA